MIATRYFHILAMVAVLLLWGISALNGTVQALFIAVRDGELGGGILLRTDYTGIRVIDFPIAMLVGFFFYGTSGADEAYQLFLLDAYVALQPAFVWLYIEAMRPGTPRGMITRPVLFGILWQCFGGAISLPLYFAAHRKRTCPGSACRADDVHRARALPLSYLLGAVLPTVVGMAPGIWLDPNSRPASTQQMVLAMWQPDPLWVAALMVVLTNVSQSYYDCGATGVERRRTAHYWVKATLLLVVGTSGITHLYVAQKTLGSSNDAVHLVRMYLPFPFTGPSGAEHILARGPWLFLQYDFLLIALSSLSWAFLQLRDLPSTRRFSSGTLGVLLFIGGFAIGPGATVSIALLVRETLLPETK